MKPTRRSGLVLGLSLLTFTPGCGSLLSDAAGKKTEPPRDSAQHLQRVPGLDTGVRETPLQSSFVVDPSTQREVTNAAPSYRIGIKPEALGKEFLLRANVVKGAPSATFSNLKSRIVRFTQAGDKLYLIESSQGHTVQNDLAQALILAEFPLLGTDEQAIYFDFNRGMSKLYVMQDWYAQDLSGATHPTEEQHFSAQAFEISFLKSVSIPQPESLQIVQAAQVRSAKGFFPAEIYYHLSPYQPSPDFKPVISTDKTKVGFFEVTPEINATTGKTIVHASKFSLAKPIEFALSSNTPAEFRETIKEGILYWNKAFGREVVKVIDAPQDVVAPSYVYNVVQWIDWQDAGFAYADGQMDPRTGETLNAQIYLTSAFTHLAKGKSESLLRSLMPHEESPTTEQEKAEDLLRAEVETHAHTHAHHGFTFSSTITPEEKPTQQLGLKGFDHQPLCVMTEPRAIALSIIQMRQQGTSDEDVLLIVKDYLRHVVAHETGHVLGLRHNFGGHIGLNFPLAEKDGIFASYLKTHTLPENIMTSTSVMDYLQFEDTVLSGHQIHARPQALPYDEKAISVLYEGKTLDQVAPLPLYCTDSHLTTYLECTRFASGPSPLAASAYEGKKLITQLPYFLLDYFIQSAKAPGADEKSPILDQLPISSLKLATLLAAPRQNALNTLKRTARSLTIERSYAHSGEQQRAEIAQKQAKWLAEELAKVQGWEGVLDHHDGKFAENLNKGFEQVLATHRSGTGSQGAYSFSDDEVDAMKRAVASFGPLLAKSLQLVELLQLATVREVSDTPIDAKGTSWGDTYGTYLAKKAAVTVLDRQAEKIPSFYRVAIPVELEGLPRIAVYRFLKEKLPKLLQVVYGNLKDTSTLSPEEMPKYVQTQLNARLDKFAAKLNVGELIKRYNLAPITPTDTSAPTTDSTTTPSEPTSATEPTVATGDVPTVAPSTTPVTATVAVTTLIPLQLSNFRAHYILRAFALLLLKTHGSKDLSFGMQYRHDLGQMLEMLYNQDLRGLSIEKLSYENQPKTTNVWLQENRMVLGALSEKTAVVAASKK